jgi:hypothetical protein
VRVQPAEQRERLAHGQELLQRGLLELDPRFLAEARAERLAAVQHEAGRWPGHAFHHLDGRRLAGAVWSEQAEALPFRNRERHAVDRAHAGVLLDEFADLEHGIHGEGHAI